jgi:hypothetical protein
MQLVALAVYQLNNHLILGPRRGTVLFWFVLHQDVCLESRLHLL